MSQYEKLSDLVKVRSVFAPAIYIDQVEENPEYRRRRLESYIITPEVEELFKVVANTIKGDSPFSTVQITGHYGSGKSFFFLGLTEFLLKPNNKSFLSRFSNPWLKDNLLPSINEGNYIFVYLYGNTMANFEKDLLTAFYRSIKGKLDLDFIYQNRVSTIDRYIEGKDKEDRMRRDLFEGAMRKDNTCMYSEIKDLREDIAGCDRDAAKTFDRIFEEAFGGPFGQEKKGTILEPFEEAETKIKESGYKGIIVFFDEYSAFLTDAKERDIKNISAFIDFCNEKSKSTTFILAAYESQTAVVSQCKKAYEKYRERINEFELEIQSIEKLLSGAIEHPYPDGIQEGFDFERLIEIQLKLAPELEKPEQIIRGYYPFHPITVHFLPILAKQFSEENRTIFNYLDDSTDVGFKGLIKKEPIFTENNVPNLVTVDKLFDYFYDRMRHKKPNESQFYEKVINQFDDDFIKKAAKVILILHIIDHETVHPDFDNIFQVLNYPKKEILEDALGSLCEKGLLMQRHDGEYHFPFKLGQYTREQVEDKVNEVVDKQIGTCTSQDLIDELKNWYRLEIEARRLGMDIDTSLDISAEYESKEYLERYKIPRKYQIKHITVEEGQSLLSRFEKYGVSQNTYNNIYCFLLIDSIIPFENEYTEAVAVADRFENMGLTTMISQQIQIQNSLAKWKAMTHLIETDKTFKTDDLAIEIVEQNILRTFISQLKNQLKVQNFAFISNYLKKDYKNKPILDIVDDIALEQYREFPEGITAQGLFLTSNKSVLSGISSPNSWVVEDTDSKKPAQIANEGLYKLGFLKRVHKEPHYSFLPSKPKKSNQEKSYKIWMLFEDAISLEQPTEGGELKALFAKLQCPHYGIPDPLLVYIFAIYCKKMDAQLYYWQEPHEPQSDSILHVFKYPEASQVILTSPQREKVRFLKGLCKTLAQSYNIQDASHEKIDPALTPKITNEHLDILRKVFKRWHDEFGSKALKNAEDLGTRILGPAEVFINQVNTGITISFQKFEKFIPDLPKECGYPKPENYTSFLTEFINKTNSQIISFVDNFKGLNDQIKKFNAAKNSLEKEKVNGILEILGEYKQDVLDTKNRTSLSSKLESVLKPLLLEEKEEGGLVQHEEFECKETLLIKTEDVLYFLAEKLMDDMVKEFQRKRQLTIEEILEFCKRQLQSKIQKELTEEK